MTKSYNSSSLPATLARLKEDLEIIADSQDGEVDCIFVKIHNDQSDTILQSEKDFSDAKLKIQFLG